MVLHQQSVARQNTNWKVNAVLPVQLVRVSEFANKLYKSSYNVLIAARRRSD